MSSWYFRLRVPDLQRELLYTAVTRARRRVTLVGSRASVLTALSRSERRVSGLRHPSRRRRSTADLLDLNAGQDLRSRKISTKMTAVWVNVEGRAVVRQQDPVALRLSLQQCASPERTGTVPYRHW